MPAERFPADSVPARRPDARGRRIRGRAYVGVGRRMFEVDEVALFILKQVDGRSTMREIGRRLAAEYEIPDEEALTDSAELVSQLVAFGVVEAAG